MKGDSRVIETARLLLKDEDVEVRQVAISVFSKFADSNKQSTSTLCPYLADKNLGVRCAAVDALARLVGKGHEEVLAAVIALLEHEHAGIRSFAVEALEKLADRGDQYAIDAATACLQDGTPAPR